MPAQSKRPDKHPSEVLATVAYGPDGQVRSPGEAPAPQWYAEPYVWFLEDLRALDPPRLVAGDPAQAESAPAAAEVAEVAELAAAGDRGRGNGR